MKMISLDKAVTGLVTMINKTNKITLLMLFFEFLRALNTE